MNIPMAVTDSHQFWGVALGIGGVVILVVIAVMLLLLSFVKDIQTSVEILLETAPKLAAQTEYIPQLQATTPVLEQIVEEAVVQDGYMNALTDGYEERV